MESICPYCGVGLKIVNNKFLCPNCGIIEEHKEESTKDKQRSYIR